jgi:hypothetical protein
MSCVHYAGCIQILRACSCRFEFDQIRWSFFFYFEGPLAYKKHSDPAGDLTKLQKGWHTLVLKTWTIIQRDNLKNFFFCATIPLKCLVVCLVKIHQRGRWARGGWKTAIKFLSLLPTYPGNVYTFCVSQDFLCPGMRIFLCSWLLSFTKKNLPN